MLADAEATAVAIEGAAIGVRRALTASPDFANRLSNRRLANWHGTVPLMPLKAPTSSLESLMHHLRRLIGLSGVLSYLAVPAGLAAQVGGGVGFFGSLENADPITRTLGGLSLSVGTPFVSLRGNGAIGMSTLGTQATLPSQTASDLVWSTGADLMLGPVNAGLGEGFMPYTFVGLGMESSAQPVQFTDAIRTWGYGGGLQLGLGHVLSVSGEARWRRLAAPATYTDSQFVRGIEYRVGLGLHFGGNRSRNPIYTPRRSSSPRRTSSVPPSAPRPSPASRTTWPV